LLTKKEHEVLELRVKRGLTQVAVAGKLGISQAAVSHFERSAFKKIHESKKIIEIANNLNINIEIKDEFNVRENTKAHKKKSLKND
jgi:transcriptional regulator